MKGSLLRHAIAGCLVLVGLVFLTRGVAAFLVFGVSQQIDAWVAEPEGFASSQATSVEQAVVVAGAMDPWNPDVPFQFGRLDLWQAEHLPRERAARMGLAESHFRQALKENQLCGLCRLQLAYVFIMSGQSPAKVGGLIEEAVKLVGREGYAIEPIARVSALVWGWLGDSVRDELVVTFAFHLPYARDRYVPILEASNLWGRIGQKVMSERMRQSAMIRRDYGMED